MMIRRNWFAGLLAGVVLAVGFCGKPSLQAAEKKSLRGPAKVVGIVTAKSDKDITIKADGRLNAGDKVKVTWYYDERLRATKIQVISKAKQGGPAEKKGKTAPESSGQSESDK
jgi:multidrug efflux pump subunit AcrA (membrane-fusion protein)